jgi:hypothetical protein
MFSSISSQKSFTIFRCRQHRESVTSHLLFSLLPSD